MLYAQMYWPYHEPNRLKGKDHHDQHEEAIRILEEDQVAATKVELVDTPMRVERKLVGREEEAREDPDAITPL